MSKFIVGDVVTCTIKPEDWDESETVVNCGDGDNEMRSAMDGRKLTIELVGDNSYPSYKLRSKGWDRGWWFHENDLQFEALQENE